MTQHTGIATQEEVSTGRHRTFWNGFDWAFAISFANILFFRTWSDLLQERHILPVAFATAIVNVLLVAVCVRIACFVGERSRNRLIHWLGILAFAGLWLLPFHALTTVHFAEHTTIRNLVYLSALVLAAGIVASRRLRTSVIRLCAMFALFAGVTFGQAIWRIATYDAARWTPPSASVPGPVRGARVVWLLFDEMDYGLSFAARKPGLQLPELDRLVGESFHATKAHPPGRTTLESVPRLISGDMNATPGNIGNRETIFSRAKQDGLHSVAIGWQLYCEVESIRKTLDGCWMYRSDAERNSMGTALPEIAINQFRWLFENQFRSPFGQPMGAKRQALDFRFNRRVALEAAPSGGLDFVYIHFNVPHEPLFYDASTGRDNLGEKPIVSMLRKYTVRYWDALQLVDRTLGELRRSMETAGVWDKSHIVLTSDHPYRVRWRIDGVTDDSRVPFIIRTAGASRSIAFDRDFNTAVVADLTTALLRGEFRSNEDVAPWMNQHAAK